MAPPVRNFWNKGSVFRAPQEKPFLSSPQINGLKAKEVDYHVHTNAIPTHANPIKQVGEKGPIHTIPAPNLSLADKPAVLEEARKEVPKFYTPVFQTQNHQYQVTEPTEPSYNHFKQPYYQDIPGLEAQTSAHKAEQAAVKPLEQHFQQNQIPPHELYELLQQTQQIPQQQFDYQIVLNANQGEKAEGFFDQVQPEYHSFNYEEQQKHPGISVGADYNLEPAADSSEIHQVMARNPNDQMAQAQYVQQYFDRREESTSDNYVEQEDKTQDGKNLETTQSDVITSAFYSTLPNRQAAEALASLQAAGQQRQAEVRQQTPLTIYIPDKEEENEGDEQREDYGNRIKKRN